MKQVKRPIKSKINRAILITSTVVLLITGFTYVIYEFVTFHDSTIERMSVLGEVIANNSTAALAFDNREEAYEILSALRAQEQIVAAVLYDEDGVLFTKYPKNLDESLLPPTVKESGFLFSDRYLEKFQPVILGSNSIGTLYLKYDMQVLSQQLRFFGIVAVSLFILSFLLAYLLSSQLQKRISKPIIALADVAQSISRHKDYSTRAVKQSEDEIGLLTDAFNQMLSQIEQQSHDLLESEKKFRTLADNIPNLCWMANADGSIYWYNSQWYKYTGTTEENMDGWNWSEFHHPDVLPDVLEKWNDSIATGNPLEMVFPLRDAAGSYKPFLTRVVPVKDSQGNTLKWFGTNTDISKVREAEKALRKSEEFNRSLLESSPDCVKVLDLQRKLVSINPQGLKMLEIDDFTKWVGHDWLELWAEEYRADVKKAIQKAQNGEIGHFQAFSPTIKGNYKWWDVLVAPVYTTEGKVERLISVSRDISKLKKLEQQKDDFLSIASHELKTPVTSLKVYTELLLKKFQNTEDTLSADILAKMDGQIVKLTTLITDLLDVTKIEQGKLLFSKEKFEFNSLANEIIEDIQRTSDTHRIVQRLASDVTLTGDRDRIGQVITNFLTNAIKYSPKADEIIVSTEINNEELIFSVQDFGLGLSEKDRDKVFDRFFRSGDPHNRTYPGLGLGLFISSTIINRHNGEIWVESEKGEGSVFRFSLSLKNPEA